MARNSTRKNILMAIAGVCFLLPALRYFYLHGFAVSGHGASADSPWIYSAEFLAGVLFLIRAAIEMRKSGPQNSCRSDVLK